MTEQFTFRCTGCGREEPPSVHVLQCAECGEPFEIEYLSPPHAQAPRIPLHRPESQLSLGEGGTPAIRLPRVGQAYGLARLWAKLEFIAPTGSFKDRGTSVLISAAVEQGIHEFAEDSSGNAGASLSAYAASAGLAAHMFVPASAAAGKKAQIQIFGAELYEIEGPRSAATEAARRFVQERGAVWLSHNMSPYFSEGMKSFAFEIADDHRLAPQHVVFPVGNGSLIIGAWHGYQELVAAGRVSRIPKLHAVQAEAVAPVVAEVQSRPWNDEMIQATVAGGIAVSHPPRLKQIVGAVAGSGGTAVAVDEGAILHWRHKVAAEEGVFMENTSAAAFAGLERLVATGVIRPGEEVLVAVTGSGLKEPV